MTGRIISVIAILQSLFCLFTTEVHAAQPGGISCFGYPALHVYDVRFYGCSEQPCNIRKGEHLPFELDMSFDNSTESVDRVYLSVYNHYYAVPPALYAERISYASCDNDTLGFGCPIYPNVRYTLKSSLFIDKRAVCRAGCENLGPDGTGLRDVSWTLGIYNNHKMSADAQCRFEIELNITA